MNENPQTTPAPADQRIDVRLSTQAKELIEHAAAIEGISTSAFVVANALFNARQVIAEHEKWVLSRKDSRAFVAALINPPEPNDALKDAAERQARLAAPDPDDDELWTYSTPRG